MKLIGIEISAACYNSLRFRYDFSNFVTSRYYHDPFHSTKFRPCFIFIAIYVEGQNWPDEMDGNRNEA